ncbi:hypothetical protein CN661_002344, partial [Escherichia coli]|nr:hypothetical protein [Escherichia coli]
KENSSKNGIGSIINSIIDKLISKNLGGYERIAIVNRGLSNLFSVAQLLEITFEDKDKIEELLTVIATYPSAERARAAETILYDLFRITNRDIKDRIATFIKDTPTTDFNEEKKIKYDLFLVAAGISDLDANLPHKIEKLIEKYKKYSFDSEAITLRDQLNFVVKTKNLNEFSIALAKLEEIINNYK